MWGNKDFEEACPVLFQDIAPVSALKNLKNCDVTIGTADNSSKI
jgi:hypothetical protein